MADNRRSTRSGAIEEPLARQENRKLRENCGCGPLTRRRPQPPRPMKQDRRKPFRHGWGSMMAGMRRSGYKGAEIRGTQRGDLSISTERYKESGVDIDAGNALVEAIKPAAKSTARLGTAAGLGGFGALFDLKACGYRDPILVATTDGVGTKLKVAI